MLFRRETLEGIADGSITLAFRCWHSAAAKSGGTQRTALGVVRFGNVERIERDSIGEGEAKAAGYPNRAALLRELINRTGDAYRIELAGIDADPREALREQADIDPGVLAWLVRIGWARPILTAIANAPGVRAAELAAVMGMERDRFKAKVRELKNRGLTISLETGYRLSSRGVAALAMLDRSP